MKRIGIFVPAPPPSWSTQNQLFCHCLLAKTELLQERPNSMEPSPMQQLLRYRMLLKRGMGNGELKWEIENEKLIIFLH